MERIIFLSSLPRAGNTLLGSILNQNKKVKVSPNSITINILSSLFNLKKTELYQNFPNYRSIDNLIVSALPIYYQDWNAELIIDRGPWGTPYNLSMIKNFIKKPKFILLLRPLVECVASFAKLQIESGEYTKQNVYKYINKIMGKEHGILGTALWSIDNIIKNNEDYKIFYFKDLVKNTDMFLKEMSDFIGVNIKKPKTLEQFNINNIYYQKDIIKNLHKIRTESIDHKQYDLEEYLTRDMIEYYKNFDFKIENEKI